MSKVNRSFVVASWKEHLLNLSPLTFPPFLLAIAAPSSTHFILDDFSLLERPFSEVSRFVCWRCHSTLCSNYPEKLVVESFMPATGNILTVMMSLRETKLVVDECSKEMDMQAESLAAVG
jgi:hypothetical protein